MSNAATSILRKEHDAIIKMLEATDEVARQIEAAIPVAPEVLTGILEFLRLFADRCHHGKEEDLLFPMLEQKGMPRNGGPVGVMLHEHEMGRAFMGEMVQAAEAYASGDKGAAARWAGAACGYTNLLRAHIQKENQILFVMAERMLTEEEQDELAAEFEKIEVVKMGAGTHERLHMLMAKLQAEIFPTSTARA